MKNQFDELIERRDSGCLKWDASTFTQSAMYCESRDIIPMWIADMDFRTPTFVTDALSQRLEHPVFGYQFTPESYFSSIAQWQKKRYAQEGVGRENVAYQNSVLGGVASALIAFSQPGDHILIHQPTYIGFQQTIQNLGRNSALSPLSLNDKGIFSMDLADMEAQIKNKKIPVFIFCSPHNPTGRVWDKEELEQVVALCEKYGVKIISDEIWADFILDSQKKHIPTTSINEKAKEITISLYAPSKTFNLAGLVGAYSLCFNKSMNDRVQKVAVSSHYNMPNALSVASSVAAFEQGEAWVEDLLCYLRVNASYFADAMNKISGFSAYVQEATYLMWVNVKDSPYSVDEIQQKLKSVGVLPSLGRDFYGETYLRFNIACPFSRIQDAAARISSVLGS
ncbi:MAG: aminotransferase class I/II-fold pyridoxal phosphate-dependent enzyme [Eubacteriales bacterium]